MSGSSASSSGGIGCGGLLAVGLTILFIGLKLTDNIDWSWWAVLSPLLFYTAVTIFVVIVAVIVAIILAIRS